MRPREFRVVGNLYRKNGTVNERPYVIATFKVYSDALYFCDLKRLTMATHNIRVITIL